MKLKQSQVFNSQLDDYETVYEFTHTKPFSSITRLNPTIIKKVFNFSYAMIFDTEGVYRSAGKHSRKNGENFAAVFQDKLAEFAFWKYISLHNVSLHKPDLNVFTERKWNANYFTIKQRRILIKSSNSYGQALLLETKDWNKKGLYIPEFGSDLDSYNYFVLVRLNHSIPELMKTRNYYYCEEINKDDLYELITKQAYSYDIPGFLTRQHLINIIKDECYIPRGAYLNKLTKESQMDTSNYYVQVGLLDPVRKLIIKLKQF